MKNIIEELRRDIKMTADDVRAFQHQFQSSVSVDGEVVANIILSYRHLEDAAMRLGKAIQALDGGVSVYDRTQVPGA